MLKYFKTIYGISATNDDNIVSLIRQTALLHIHYLLIIPSLLTTTTIIANDKNHYSTNYI
jgi:hypothetical protein